MISGVPHDTPENPHDFAIRPGSPAGPEGPSPSARRNGPAWASRARSASKWWVQPPNRTSAQPASMVERLADMADMAGPADVTLRHMQRCDFDWFPEHKLSTYQTYHYFQWDFIPFSLFFGVHGGAICWNCPGSEFLCQNHFAWIGHQHPLTHGAFHDAPSQQDEPRNGCDQEQAAHVVPRSHVHIHHGIFT